jgi:cytochrome c-type biogenesis protein CcmH
MKFLFLVFLAVLMPLSSHALPVEQPLADPVLEGRAKALFREIRCVVCQSESINDSNAPLAADLRRMIRHRVAEGESADAIKVYLNERYGEVIFLEPPVTAKTYLLWLLPLFFLGGGVVVVLRMFRMRIPQTNN